VVPCACVVNPGHARPPVQPRPRPRLLDDAQ
jgi:hypothetical protein